MSYDMVSFFYSLFILPIGYYYMIYKEKKILKRKLFVVFV